MWVKLSAQSVRDFCHETSGEAWSLCAGLDNTIYLQHEGQQALDQQVQYTTEAQYGTGDPQIGFTTPGESQIGFTVSGDAPRGFDFTSAQHVPTLPVFGAPQGMLSDVELIISVLFASLQCLFNGFPKKKLYM